MNAHAKDRALIGTTHGPGQIGGLTAAVAALAVATGRELEWRWFSRLSGRSQSTMDLGRWERRQAQRLAAAEHLVLEPAGPARRLLPLTTRLVHHGSGGAAASRAVYRRAYLPALTDAGSPSAALVLWVGTGLELLGFVAREAARRTGAPFFVTPFLHSGVWGDAPIDAALYRGADHVFATTHHERAVLEGLGVKTDAITVTGLAPVNALPGDGRRWRAELGLAGAPVLLFLGRRRPEKGLPVTLEAHRALLARHPDSRLVIIGPDGEGARMSAPGVIDLGERDAQDVADALDAADVLCVPSAAESFGLVYVEAWARGTPVIAGRSPVLQELVRDGVDGLLVPQDPAAVAEALRTLIDDPRRGRQMGEAGRARQEAEFTWDRVARRYLDGFASVPA